jgi:predicted HD superfamily hydrolase involved in NAD metabolism
MNKTDYLKIISERLTPPRLQHSLRVLEKALELAERSGVKRNKVYVAALLHDIAKDLPPSQLLAIARRHDLLTCEAEEVQPDLLHGPVGALYCKKELGIRDEEVLQTIHYHTTGHPSMTELDKIIYLADLIEPGRTYEGVDELRKICRENRDQGLLYAFDCTIQYVLRRKMLLHPLTVKARNQLILDLKDLKKEE